jgi:hypothetical protein
MVSLFDQFLVFAMSLILLIWEFWWCPTGFNETLPLKSHVSHLELSQSEAIELRGSNRLELADWYAPL